MKNKKTKHICAKCKITHPDRARFVYLDRPNVGGGGLYCLDCASTILIEIDPVQLFSVVFEKDPTK